MAEQAPLVDRVMDKIEEFYFEDGENGGEALFNKFMTEKHVVFADDFDQQDQKVE